MELRRRCPESLLRLPEAEERRCRRYAYYRLVLSFLELVAPVTLLAGLTLGGGAGALLALVAPLPPLAAQVSYLALLGVLVHVVLLPIQFSREHWLERKFGISRQGSVSWLVEWTARSAITGAALAAALLPVVATLRWWPALALFWCTLFLPARAAFFRLLYYPLLASFYPVSFLRHETFSLPGVGRITLPVYLVRVGHKTRRANAGIRIHGSKRAIYVTDTLLEAFNDEEERVVMAHEFGHLYDQLHLEERTRTGIAQAHRKLLLASAQILSALAALTLMHFLAPRLGLAGVADLAGFPLLAGFTLLLSHGLSPLLYAEARRDEHDADNYALQITGDLRSYVSVMRKLRRLNLEESAPSGLTRLLLDTHPSYVARVREALGYRPRRRRRRPAHWRGWRHIQRHGRR
jgi:STE24 endopeptidase